MAENLELVVHSDGEAESRQVEDDLRILEIPFRTVYHPREIDQYDPYTLPSIEMNQYPFGVHGFDSIWACFIRPLIDLRGISVKDFYKMEEDYGKNK